MGWQAPMASLFTLRAQALNVGTQRSFVDMDMRLVSRVVSRGGGLVVVVVVDPDPNHNCD